MLHAQLPGCLQMPLPMLCPLAAATPVASLLATPKRRAPRVPATALLEVGAEDGGTALFRRPGVALAGIVAPLPHPVVGLDGRRLHLLGVLLAGLRFLLLVGRARINFPG